MNPDMHTINQINQRKKRVVDESEDDEDNNMDLNESDYYFSA